MKTVFILAFATLSIFKSFSQNTTDTQAETFNFGLRHGYSSYNLISENEDISDLNLYGGLFIAKRFSEKFAVQFETNYSGLSILHFPLLLKYRITDKFELYGGAALDFSLEQQNTDEAFRNKRFGTSLILGVQYYIDTHWFIEARYIHGMTDQIPIFNGFDVEPIYAKKRDRKSVV